mmetsp:Transcript_28789/g.61395  ORF Transcript_28789/g.61395 Transcript_28789/m.61395 type:complete len:118 (-) Transcript_28789:367-720(-)|eukprot:CAMPEP_0172298292 /NCGR_PEP_ID=MMETSP1058-20130122/1019_1 /TAXON_ID=83371 /ORGANISM="Detonula confervacea, Strain CCMP 353" /LENGTH=117 /DNA_ID=CAMNT_0013007557 /DNA_START=106 /DNA_END=459 /DNA_ORIENTATION=-
MSQIDGAFPRLNASMLHSGSHNGGIVSLIGKAVSFDGSNTLEFECVDGGKVQVQVNPDFDFQQGKVMEIMGAANEDKTIQFFINRELGEGFDFDTYNQMISKVLTNPKYSELFGAQG